MWYFKERLILVVVVIALCYCVYRVVYPPPLPEIGRLPRPTEDISGVEAPPVPPEVSLLSLPESYTLTSKNPFWYYSGAPKRDEKDALREQILNSIHLLSVRKAGDTKKAKIQTNATRWYDEGSKFEQFELREVNIEDQSCVVYSEGLGDVITLTVQR